MKGIRKLLHGALFLFVDIVKLRIIMHKFAKGKCFDGEYCCFPVISGGLLLMWPQDPFFLRFGIDRSKAPDRSVFTFSGEPERFSFSGFR